MEIVLGYLKAIAFLVGGSITAAMAVADLPQGWVITGAVATFVGTVSIPNMMTNPVTGKIQNVRKIAQMQNFNG